MTIGAPLTVEALGPDGEWAEYLNMHALQVNKDRTSERYEGGGEQDRETVKFRVRWCRPLAAIEFDKPSYRVVFNGNVYDIRGYDDYMYRHRTVDLRCVSHG